MVGREQVKQALLKNRTKVLEECMGNRHSWDVADVMGVLDELGVFDIDLRPRSSLTAKIVGSTLQDH